MIGYPLWSGCTLPSKALRMGNEEQELHTSFCITHYASEAHPSTLWEIAQALLSTHQLFVLHADQAYQNFNADPWTWDLWHLWLYGNNTEQYRNMVVWHRNNCCRRLWSHWNVCTTLQDDLRWHAINLNNAPSLSFLNNFKVLKLLLNYSVA